MQDAIQEVGINKNGNYSYAFEYLIANSDAPVNFATAHDFKDKKMGIVSTLAKGSINTVFACIFGYEYFY